MLELITCSIIAYLIGSVNSSIIVSYMLKKGDIRTKGSGNAGTTNTMRTIGKRAAGVVLLFDILKGILSVYIARVITGSDDLPAVYLAAFFAVIGHIFPLYFRFKGGKGVATALSVIFMLKYGWIFGLILLVIAIPLIIITRYMSLSVLIAVLAHPILTIIYGGSTYYTIFSIIIVLSIYITHKDNIVRLFNGKENKLSWGKKDE